MICLNEFTLFPTHQVNAHHSTWRDDRTETMSGMQGPSDETKGRMVILDQGNSATEGEGEDTGFQWPFLCIQCVRDWKERGLKREGLPHKEVLERLDKEYPIA